MQVVWNEITEKITGLDPVGILCVGTGFVREEWKSLCFKGRKSITQNSILSPKQIAQLLVPEAQNRILENSARLELLRLAVKNSQVREALPILTQRRFRPRFFEGLDRALQQGRMLFAHEEEATVFEERLKERTGVDLKREEFFLLNRYWQKLLEARNLWDEARLFADAASVLQNGDLPPSLAGKEIFKLEHFQDLPRLEYFWNEISKVLSLRRILSKELLPHFEDQGAMKRKEAHSLEDAILFLMDHLQEQCKTEEDLDAHAVVIPDEPALRRTLKRVAESRGFLFQDSRDPTQVLQSEEMKLCLLELELVAKGFTAAQVMTWMGTQPSLKSQVGDLRKKIIEKGIVSGLQSYSWLPTLFPLLLAIKERYSSRCTLMQLRESVKQSARILFLPAWVDLVLDRIFTQWEESFEQLELQDQKRPIRYWLEQLQDKIKKATPMVAPVKHRHGLQLYRADQAVSLALLEKINEGKAITIHFVGIDAGFFEPREAGNEWFSVRDHELLAHEFGLISLQEGKTQRLNSFHSWASLSSAHSYFWDFEYNETGSEREPADWSCFGDLLADEAVAEVEEHLGMHPSLWNSVFPKLKVHPPQVTVAMNRTEWPVSFLNAFGNCGFSAFASHVLRLYDERETDFELKGDVFGNLIHSAAESVLKLKLLPEEAFEKAWKSTTPTAWLKSPRLYTSIRYKAIQVLNTLLLSESEYQARAQTVPTHFEMEVNWEKDGMNFIGRIDRIDQHRDGLVVVDYKTSASSANGQAMLDQGRDLQLPIYSLAIQKKLDQPVIAAQYLQLAPLKTNRHVGILFTKWNQARKDDPIELAVTKARSNSKSLFSDEPEVVWERVNERVTTLIRSIRAGNFSAAPVDPKVCVSCRYELVCGKARKGNEPVVMEGGEE